MPKVQIPATKEKAIKEFVYQQAEQQHYQSMSKEESGIFMDQLATNEKVGGVLSQYMAKSRVHRYIKDAILNRYSKIKSKENIPTDIKGLIESILKIPVTHSHTSKDVQLFRVAMKERPNEFVVMSVGTYVKWETALRKALLYRAKYPFSLSANKIHQVLLLSGQGKVIPPSDKQLLDRALEAFGTVVVLF